MNNKPNWESSLIAKFGELKVNSKPPTGLLREKTKPLLLKPETEPVNGLVKPAFTPHPPQGPKKATSVPSSPVHSPVKKPTPPSTSKTKGTFRRKYSKSEEIWYEDRVSGDGEASKEDDIYIEKDIILERQPGDGCFSDIAEEDEEDDDDEECMNDDDEVDDEEEIDYDCDGLEEEELGEYHIEFRARNNSCMLNGKI